MLNLSLKKTYFDAIKTGLKTVEGRVNSSKFNSLRPGLEISFSCEATHEILFCTLEAIHIYQDFRSMLLAEGIENMLPGINSLEVGVALYESFPGYKELVKENGAIAMRIKVWLKS